MADEIVEESNELCAIDGSFGVQVGTNVDKRVRGLKGNAGIGLVANERVWPTSTDPFPFELDEPPVISTTDSTTGEVTTSQNVLHDGKI